jgi:hypothetical protein
VVGDPRRISRLEAECGIDRSLDPGNGALNFILERLDAGLSTNAKPRRKP